MNQVAYFKSLAGLPVNAAETAALTESYSMKPAKKDKKEKKAKKLTEAEKAEKMMKKAHGKAAKKVAKGNKKAHAVCETLGHVLASAKAHFNNKRVAKQVTEAILWKKLNDAKVEFTVTEAELNGYFTEFDKLLEAVVDTQMGAKSLHKQYDPTLDGNMYKDSKKVAANAGKAPAYKKDGDWKGYNEKARDKGITDTQNPGGGKPGDRTPVPGQDAAFVDGNQHPSTQNKLGEDAEGVKKAVEAMGKSPAADKAKEALTKAQGGYGSKKEGFDMDWLKKTAGINAEAEDQILYVVSEAETGKIECMFPDYPSAVAHVEKMKAAAGKQGYVIDPRKFSKGFHFSSSGESYTNEKK